MENEINLEDLKDQNLIKQVIRVGNSKIIHDEKIYKPGLAIRSNFDQYSNDKKEVVNLEFDSEVFEILPEGDYENVSTILIDEFCNDEVDVYIPAKKIEKTINIITKEVVTEIEDEKDIVFHEHYYVKPYVAYNCLKDINFVKSCLKKQDVNQIKDEKELDVAKNFVIYDSVKDIATYNDIQINIKFENSK